MERGLHFGNVSISLVLLLLLKALTGSGTSSSPGSAAAAAVGREPPPPPSEEDAAGVMEERGLESVGGPVIAADVTVEDDTDNGSAGEADETYGESNGDQPSR